MRTHLRRKYRLQRIFAALAAAAGVAGCAAILFYSLPGISGYMVKAGVISAGFVLPEGGLAVLEGGLAQEESQAVSAAESVPESSVLPEKSEEPEESAPKEESKEESAPAETSYPPIEVSVPAVADENKAELVHKTYTVSPSNIYIPLENGYIKNCTSISKADIETQVKNPPYFTIEDTDEPQVLIMHTHTTESYVPFTGDYYDKTMSFRSTDNSQNMAVVGDRIASELEAAGIGVIHDATQHDYPSYNGAYDRSQKTVEQYLAEYPSIKVVLDIHRDAIYDGEGNPYKVVSQVAEGRAAQMTFVIGTDGSGLPNDNWPENLKLAAAVQDTLLEDYPTLMRPITVRNSRYNQHCTTGSLLVEVGAAGNSLDEALLSARLLAAGLAETLQNAPAA